MRVALTLLLVLLAGCTGGAGPPEVEPWPERPDAGVPEARGVLVEAPPASPSDPDSSGCDGTHLQARMEPLGDGWAVRAWFPCGGGAGSGDLRLLSPDQSLRPPEGVSWRASLPANGTLKDSFLFPAEVVGEERAVVFAAWFTGPARSEVSATAAAQLERGQEGWTPVHPSDFEEEVPRRNGTERDVGPWVQVTAPERGRWDHGDGSGHNGTAGHVAALLRGDATGRFSVRVVPQGIEGEPSLRVHSFTEDSLAFDGHEDWTHLHYPEHRAYFRSLGAAPMGLAVEVTWQDGPEAQVRCLRFTIEPANPFVFYLSGEQERAPC